MSVSRGQIAKYVGLALAAAFGMGVIRPAYHQWKARAREEEMYALIGRRGRQSGETAGKEAAGWATPPEYRPPG